MKKVFLTLAASCLLGLSANAQIMLGYGFKAEAGTYVPMTEGTAIATANNELGAEEDAADVAFFQSGKITDTDEVTGYPIGFDFLFGDKMMSTFGVSTSGYIILGGDEAFSFNPTRDFYVFSTYSEDTDNVIGLALGNTRMGENSSITYKTEGEAPNRTLTIQLSDILVSLSNWSWTDAGTLDLQYILSEADHSIKMVFNNCNNFPSDNTIVCRYGLRGGYLEGLAVRSEGPWIDAYGEAGSDATIMFGNGKVEDGLTCTFTYPEPCVAPEAQPTDLVLSVTDYSIKFDYTTSDAQVYLIVYTEGDQVPAAPQNRVVYEIGDQLGAATVAYFGPYPDSEWKREIVGLEESTVYTVYIFAANAYGADGPVYLTENPLSATICTAPEAPMSIGVMVDGLTSCKCEVTANNADDQIIVVYTTEWAHNIPYASTPDYGTLSGTYQVGDLVEEGHAGRVAYIGPTGEFAIQNIPANSPLMVAAYSINAAGVYSDTNIEILTSTVCSTPFVPNLTEWTAYQDFPCGWMSDGTSEFHSVWSYGDDPQCTGLEVSNLGGSVEDPQWAAVVLPPMVIEQENVEFSVEWRALLSTSRFAKEVWNMQNDDDFIEMQVSEDGDHWTTISRIDKDNAPTITDIPEDPEAGTDEVSALDIFSPMKGDLSAYVGKEVFIAVMVSNTQQGFWGLTFNLQNIKLTAAASSDVPVITIGEVTYNSAEITWRGQQENYQVQYGVSDALSEDVITVECDQKAILLEGLEANTSYNVRVRGIAEDPAQNSEWSQWVSFRTKGWPAVEAPSSLASEIDVEANTVTLTWSNNEDYLSYNLRYRSGDVFSWTIIEGIQQNSYIFSLYELNEGTVYLWSVMALCSHDRQTSWATQEEFQTPEHSGIQGIGAGKFGVKLNNGVLTVANPGVNVKNINIVDMQGRTIATYAVNSDSNVMIATGLNKGMYIVTLQTENGSKAFRVVR